ncbi:unnamed protein product [Trifolium pratense]|uniref:Uncharacterized protein n=1 Tax=Trifolium pratense TaxID=57577 RepID=A0ACB0JZG6_TRIPR|nr:unnamed protein product [Trifolium pratense]
MHNQDNTNAEYTNTKQERVSEELQSFTSANPGLKDCGDGKHNDKTLINNLHINLSGNGNGSVLISVYNYNLSMNYPPTTYGTPVLSYYPPLRPPSAFGNKRDVLFGISYADTATPRKLKGSVNKAKLMKQFLIDKLGFPSNSIYMLTDDSEEKNTTPTKSNMRMAMRWLVEGSKPGDSLVFYFYGHGSWVKDHNVDGLMGVMIYYVPRHQAITTRQKKKEQRLRSGTLSAHQSFHLFNSFHIFTICYVLFISSKIHA